jgi:23S rRNA (cytidine1920-2'-O)/16S rRNA (cytidine1409-2'-O)-methyltransferase
MERLDIYLAKRDDVSSREKAKQLIKGGKVLLNGKKCTKPAQTVCGEDEITLTETERYVGRGALKLAKAFEVFPIDVNGAVCADIGASTGGFTQILLEHGAEYVYAVDVGHGQLAEELARNEKVRNCEGVNVRYMPADFFDRKVEFMCCDLSFISLRQVLPAMSEALDDGGKIVALIKPQFEAGRSALGKNGLVKDRKKHCEVLCGICDFFSDVSLSLQGLDFSPICGGDGNIEYLAYLVKSSDLQPKSFDCKSIVSAAFESAR